MDRKYIYIIGTCLSGIGKGVCSASIAKLLQDQGYNILQIKQDRYMCADADTLNPMEHGESFVLESGVALDLDFGTYERFTNKTLYPECSITSGKIYSEMLEKERKGDFLGKTVQLSPHYTNYVCENIISASEKHNSEITIIEVGGTLGDSESDLFIESSRQIKRLVGKENVYYICLTYIPFMHTTKDLKTKLCQNSVKQLRSYGIEPNMLICRTERKLPDKIKEKISIMSDIDKEYIIEGIDVDSIYKVPLKFKEQKVDKQICKNLNLEYKENDITEWKNLVYKMDHTINQKTIAIVGKYVELHDSYLSVVESLKIAGTHLDTKINIKWIDSENIEKYQKSVEDNKTQGIIIDNYEKEFFSDVDAIIIPGGFSLRGCYGKELAIKYCRENNISCFGICLGMQMMSIEFAKNVLGYIDATSEEFDSSNSSQNHIIHLMQSQKGTSQKGGTMRLGNYKTTIINKDSKYYQAYNKIEVDERHRHRYEFNNKYREEFIKNKMDIVGINVENNLVEAIELKDHKWFIGVQYHPEFNSRFMNPSPLFYSFIKSLL